jgi:hypothetical protein
VTARERAQPAQAAVSDWNQICPLYFEYEEGDEVVMVSAAPDLIHGMKLFKERRPRVVRSLGR